MLIKQLAGGSRFDAGDETRGRGGFTLIELLVVIAIIALLLSILLPSLKRAKEAGKRALCLYRVKSLAVAWTLYVEENDGRLPQAVATLDSGWILLILGHEMDPENATVEQQLEAMKNGLLFPYLDTTEVYRCPVAKVGEMRTYSMTHALNGHPGTEASAGKTRILKQFSEIKNTGNRIVFLDDFIRDWDGCWMIYNNNPWWWNATPIRHGAAGTVLSFADTHSEFWRWSDQDTIDLAEQCYRDNTPEARNYSPDNEQPGNPDLERMQVGVWGKLGY